MLCFYSSLVLAQFIQPSKLFIANIICMVYADTFCWLKRALNLQEFLLLQEKNNLQPACKIPLVSSDLSQVF